MLRSWFRPDGEEAGGCGEANPNPNPQGAEEQGSVRPGTLWGGVVPRPATCSLEVPSPLQRGQLPSCPQPAV